MIIAAAAVLLLADPCTFVPDRGGTPLAVRQGRTFAGPVVHVIDGDGLCVAIGPRTGVDWVEVRIADFYAPELNGPGGRAARDTLSRIAMGRRVICTAKRRSWDRIVAVCQLDGVSLGDHMREAGVREGGRGSGGPR